MMSDEQHPGGLGVKLVQADEGRMTTYGRSQAGENTRVTSESESRRGMGERREKGVSPTPVEK